MQWGRAIVSDGAKEDAKLKEKEGQEAAWECLGRVWLVFGFIWKVGQPWLHKLRTLNS